MNYNTLIYTPAIANVTGKRAQKGNVKKLVYKPTGGKKQAKKKSYGTPKISGVGWGY